MYGMKKLDGRYADLGGVRLHYVEAGEGPLVVLLHGFPQFHHMWRFQIPVLVDAGFRVVAPDMRGYNLSDKPDGIEHYRIETLARDVEQLIAERGEERATVIGHDWGAIVAWFVAMQHAKRVEKLAILNVPHPARFLYDGLSMPKQILKSFYVFFFQIPRLPEKLLSANDFAVLRAGFRRDAARHGAFSEEDVERYVEALARPGALTAAINYYRALFRGPSKTREKLRKIEAPTLVIWGEKDAFLSRELAEPGPLWVPNLRVERLPEASHWVAEDRPEEVNALLLSFLNGP
ncbi:MAG: Epoxide hydrolase [uncultured Rubrobacteraceae bacterium]|uniref:Epoxide hydrolase n=1 Tax=uncultured Rubrobacteraceae bacterium TaxID=349277 RepID=A0A6J4R4Z9_9ACTN|nr:MAG: Epoxide hydrolase [uncultured Rubrobacteraceae bacterium]